MQSQNPPPATLVPSSEDNELELFEIIAVIVENLRLLVIGPLLVSLMGVGFTYTQTPVFTAQTSILPPSGDIGSVSGSLIGQLGLMSLPFTGGVSVQQSKYLAYLRSDALKHHVIQKFDLQKRWGNSDIRAVRKRLGSSLEILENKKTGSIEITFSDPDPKLAAELLNGYVDGLSYLMGQAASTEARARRDYFEKQLAESINKTYKNITIRDAVIQNLVNQFESSRLAETQQAPAFLQVDRAEPPEMRSSPKRLKTAIVSGVSTLASLLLLIFIRYAYLQTRARPDYAERLNRVRSGLRK